jgi:hypothetical protein
VLCLGLLTAVLGVIWQKRIVLDNGSMTSIVRPPR